MPVQILAPDRAPPHVTRTITRSADFHLLPFMRRHAAAYRSPAECRLCPRLAASLSDHRPFSPASRPFADRRACVRSCPAACSVRAPACIVQTSEVQWQSHFARPHAPLASSQAARVKQRASAAKLSDWPASKGLTERRNRSFVSSLKIITHTQVAKGHGGKGIIGIGLD